MNEYCESRWNRARFNWAGRGRGGPLLSVGVFCRRARNSGGGHADLVAPVALGGVEGFIGGSEHGLG